MTFKDTYIIDYAKVEIDEQHTVRSPLYGDTYHSVAGALEESRYVFLEGAKIDSHLQSKSHVTVGEIGFGTGLNFLLTWLHCASYLKQGNSLSYLAFEKHPIKAEILFEILTPFEELTPFVKTFVEQMKHLNPGFNRIHLGNNTPLLTLLIGDANEQIKNIDAHVDAWYFDGFSPACNPDLWSKQLLRECKRISTQATTFASFSSAKLFKDALRENECTFKKQDGFAHKREMIVGHMPGKKDYKTNRPNSLAIVGAGLAGAFLAQSLTMRHVTLTVFEQESQIAAKASGNPLGIFRPDFALEPEKRNAYFFQTYMHMLRWLLLNKDIWPDFECQLHGLYRLLNTKGQQRLYHSDNIDELGPYLKKTHTSDYNGNSPSFFHPLAGTLNPQKLCQLLLQGKEVLLERKITALEEGKKNVTLHVQDSDTKNVDVVILANAFHAQELLGDTLELKRNKGEILFSQSKQFGELNTPLCYGGYMAKRPSGTTIIGASFEHGVSHNERNPEQQEYIIKKANEYFPGLQLTSHEINGGRVGFRTTTHDKMPVRKKISNRVYVSVAHGSKGLHSAPESAEHICSMIFCEPYLLQ